MLVSGTEIDTILRILSIIIKINVHARPHDEIVVRIHLRMHNAVSPFPRDIQIIILI